MVSSLITASVMDDFGISIDSGTKGFNPISRDEEGSSSAIAIVGISPAACGCMRAIWRRASSEFLGLLGYRARKTS